MEIIEVINTITLLDVVKVLMITLLVVYVVFGYLMTRMIGSMTRAVQMKDETIVKLLGFAHLSLASLVLLLSLIVL